MKINYSEITEYERLENFEPEEEEIADISEQEETGFDPLDFSQPTPEYYPLNGGWFSDLSGDGLIEMPDNHSTRVIQAGNMIEIITASNRADGSSFRHIKNLPGNRYLNTKTGAINYKKRNKKRTDSIANLNKSIKEVRWLIYNNFADGEGYFITLAYDYHMDNYEIAQSDFNSFLDKLKHCIRSKLSYIKVVEPKESGSWHFHILLKAKDGTPLQISEALIREKWGHDSVKVSPIRSVAGLAAYLGCATYTNGYDEHLGIAILNEKYSFFRRAFYKSGMHLYSKSRDLKKPKTQEMSDDEARALVADYKRVSKKFKIVKNSWKDDAHVVNIINYETFKKE